MSSRRHEGGFTLLELLVALVVFSLVLLALREGFDAATRIFERQRVSLSRQDDLDAVDRLLRQILAHADPGSGRDGPLFVGGSHGLAFRGILPRSLGVGSVAHASLSMPERATMRISLDQAHDLVLIWSPYRHVTEPVPAPDTRILLHNVTGLDCHYYSAGHWSPTWYGNTLPELIKLRLVFADDRTSSSDTMTGAETDGRHWPDIVIAPLLDALP